MTTPHLCPNCKFKYQLLVLISAFFFSLTYVSSPNDFLIIDLIALPGLLLIVFTAQVFVSNYFVSEYKLQNLILALFTTINILYLNIILNEDFLYLGRFEKGLSLLIAIYILFTLMNMVDENIRAAKLLLAIFLMATLGTLLHGLFPTTTAANNITTSSKSSAQNIRLVDFKSKPNIYFIAFDSLIPKVLLKKYLDLETTNYHDVLDSNFKRFENFFADRTPTMSSLNSLLALDLDHYSESTRNKTSRLFFSGHAPSPLFEIFKHNGYRTTTYFRSLYLGNAKGPYVDSYQVNKWDLNIENGICKFIKPWGYKAFTFLGYCHVARTPFIKNWFWKEQKSDESDHLIKSFRSNLNKSVPQIFLAYIYSPGHTPHGFNNKDNVAVEKFKQHYLEESKKTASYLNKIVSFVSNEDPQAIVYIFGDHGPWISRSSSNDEVSTFKIQDRFGIYGGIYPKDRCEQSFNTPYNNNFMTVLQGAHMIIRCLADGTNVFITLNDYKIPKIGSSTDLRYEDYLYE